MDRERILEQARKILSRKPEVAAAYVFGSIARGSHRRESDVDVGILYRREPPRTLQGLGIDLGYDLQEAIGRPVQVVVLNRAPADLVHRVLRDGVLVAEGDRRARVRFEVKKRNEYLDLLPILRRYRRLEATP